MRKILIPLLAALALPTTVNAESYWLVLVGVRHGIVLEKIEMASMEICEEQGKIYNKMTKKLINQNSYVCLKGK